MEEWCGIVRGEGRGGEWCLIYRARRGAACALRSSDCPAVSEYPTRILFSNFPKNENFGIRLRVLNCRVFHASDWAQCQAIYPLVTQPLPLALPASGARHG
jgi:hypothetical protein